MTSAKVNPALPPGHLKNVSLKASLRNVVSHEGDLSPEQAGIVSAEVFDEALTIACIGTDKAAIYIGVSKGLVSRWRSKEYREVPSYPQLLLLPLAFQVARNRIESRRFGIARAALAALVDAAGDLAIAVGE